MQSRTTCEHFLLQQPRNSNVTMFRQLKLLSLGQIILMVKGKKTLLWKVVEFHQNIVPALPKHVLLPDSSFFNDFMCRNDINVFYNEMLGKLYSFIYLLMSG